MKDPNTAPKSLYESIKKITANNNNDKNNNNNDNDDNNNCNN